jgi:hypothetical protein
MGPGNISECGRRWRDGTSKRGAHARLRRWRDEACISRSAYRRTRGAGTAIDTISGNTARPYEESIMNQPSRSQVIYLRAYYFITCWLLASNQRPVRYSLAFSCLGVLFSGGSVGLSKCRQRYPGYTRFTVLSSNACRALVERS